MIYSISGTLARRKDGFVVVDAGNIGYKIFVSPKTLSSLPEIGEEISFFTHQEVREDALELYGFLKETELVFFGKLIAVSGIGPKTALAVMAIAPVEKLAAAISEGKTDLLTRVSGIGKRTAERVVLELKGKLPALNTSETVKAMEADTDLEEALVGLGYSKTEARKIIGKLESKSARLEDRLKEALRIIKD